MIRSRYYHILLVGLLLFTGLSLASCGDDTDISSQAAKARGSSFLVAGDRNGNVYKVNPATGASTLISAIAFDSGITGTINSMVYNPATGKIFMGFGNADGCNACIADIDLAASTGTGLSVTIGPTMGMAVRSDGVIFSVDLNNLYQVDSTTAVKSTIGVLLGATSDAGYGLTFDSSDTLYLGISTGIFTLAQTTGPATLVGAYNYSDITAFQAIDGTFPNFPRINSMATHPTAGVTYAILNDSGGGLPFRYLVTVDLATATLTVVGEVFSELDGLVWIY